MISTPEGFRRLRRTGVVAGLAIALAPAGLLASPQDAAELLAKADAALAASDGIAAEVALKQAMARGARRETVAALMGEALLDQGETGRARTWLEPGQFVGGSAGRGFRQLARLKRVDGDLAGAGKALDKAIAVNPRDAGLWVEVASLRYAGGEHLAARDAAQHAVKLGPRHVAALVFNGMLVRDSQGLAAGLPWFEAALAADPDDLSALGEYAATLGDVGRASEMLAVTRRMLELDEGNARAFFLQAVLAARAGDAALARRMLSRVGSRMDSVPAAQLLRATLELEAGNTATAATLLTGLAQRQPANRRVQALLARALYLAGSQQPLLDRYAPEASRVDASPYILTLIARAQEQAGRRDLAAPLLDRAARDYSRPLAAIGSGSDVGNLLASGNLDGASALSARELGVAPGNFGALARAGDVALVRRDGTRAADFYRQAARIRMTDSLLLRLSVALELAGRGGEAADLVDGWLARSPSNRTAVWLAAATARQRKDFARAGALLDSLRRNGGESDPRLLATLAWTRLAGGDPGGAEEPARMALRLQPASSFAAQVYGAALAKAGNSNQAPSALARARGGDIARLPPVRFAF